MARADLGGAGGRREVRMDAIFNVAECAREVIEVLEKHKATFANMKEVFKLVKKDVSLKTSIHTEDSAS